MYYKLSQCSDLFLRFPFGNWRKKWNWKDLFPAFRAATGGKDPKTWALPRFWVSYALLRNNQSKKFGVEYWALSGSNLPWRLWLGWGIWTYLIYSSARFAKKMADTSQLIHSLILILVILPWTMQWRNKSILNKLWINFSFFERSLGYALMRIKLLMGMITVYVLGQWDLS